MEFLFFEAELFRSTDVLDLVIAGDYRSVPRVLDLNPGVCLSTLVLLFIAGDYLSILVLEFIAGDCLSMLFLVLESNLVFEFD